MPIKDGKKVGAYVRGSKGYDMPYTFDNKTSFDEYEEFAYDFARRDDDEKALAVRVQAPRKFVLNHWRISWLDKRAVRERFDAEKQKYMQGIKKVGKAGHRTYVIESEASIDRT